MARKESKNAAPPPPPHRGLSDIIGIVFIAAALLLLVAQLSGGYVSKFRPLEERLFSTKLSQPISESAALNSRSRSGVPPANMASAPASLDQSGESIDHPAASFDHLSLRNGLSAANIDHSAAG
jgi:hypothetical protein